MADMRCPMCGKPTPAEADVCRHCQARLKPLIAGSSGDTASARQGGTGMTDWLNDLRPSGSVDGESAPERDSQPLEDTANDWFSRLGDAAEPEKPAYSAPEWLAADTPTSGGDPNIPDWMEELGVKGELPGQNQPTANDDWAQGFQSQSSDAGAGAFQGWQNPSAADEKADTPDWLSGFSDSAATQESGSSAAVPDWLNQFGADQSASGEAAAEPAANLPDWLNQAAEADAVVGETAAQGTVPDWLSQFGSDEGQTPAAPAQEIPDWFGSSQGDSGLPGALPFGEESTRAEPTPAVEDDWFSKAGSSAFGSFTSSEAEEETPAPPASQDEPSWISRLGAGAAPPAGGSISPFVMDDEESGAVPLSDLPDWISQVSAEQPALADEASQAAPAAPPSSDAGLTPAELPTWLEAMRPVEAVAPPTSMVDADAPIENAGPLAGLRGALPAEPEIARIRKPPVYTVKMQLSESHQARVNQLEELLASEGKAEPLPERFVIASQHLLRIGIFVAMVVAILLAFSLQDRSIPMPQSALEEVSLVNGTINLLPMARPVLVALDYEPAQSGEMDAALAPVLRHLIQRGSYITLVSTSPNGTFLSKRLLDDYNHHYQYTSSVTTDWIAFENQEPEYHQYVHLGYIPGGLMGLQAFALKPQEMMPYALPDPADAITNTISSTFSISDTLVWQQPAWKDIQTIDQFSLVVVATDDATVARAWIEQTATLLGKGKLVMAVSAQIEPMVRPYYESEPRQLVGYVAGLTGAARYEELTTFNGAARLYWNAFSASLLAASVLIVIGVIWQIGLKVGRARKK